MRPSATQAVSPQCQSQVADQNHFDARGAATISAGHAVHDTYSAFLNPLLPHFMETMSLSRSAAGALTIFMRWPSLLQPLLGHLSDRYRLKELFILAPAISAIAMSVIGIAPTYLTMAFLLIATGLGSASLHAVGPAIVGKLSGNKLGRGMGFWMVGGEIGRVLGPITIVTIIDRYGSEGMPWLMIGGILTSMLLWYQLRDLSNGQEHQETIALPWREALVELRPLLIPLMAIVATRNFSASALSTYLPILMHDQGSSLWLSGASLSIFEAAGVIGALTGGTISDKIGRRSILSISMLGTPLLMFVFLKAGGILQMLLLLALGFLALSVTPVNMAMVQEASPRNRAMGTGIFMAGSFLCNAIIVVLLGIMGDRLGMEAAFVFSAIISLVGLPLVFRLPTGRRAHTQG